MILLGLADIHSDVVKLEMIEDEITSADIIILVGDITHFGVDKEAKAIVDFIIKRNDLILAVSGNCDYPEVDDYLNRKGLNIHGSCRIIDGIGFIGIGGSLTTPFNTPNEYSEEEYRIFLDKALSDLPQEIPKVLVAHQPPIETASDLLNTGEHVGSMSVRRFIEEHQPLICFTGHIHEAAGIDKIGETQIVNPGPIFNGQYAYANVGSKVNEVLIRRID